jgi:hypothetical protein
LPKRTPSPSPDHDRFAQRISELRARLREADPYFLADRTASRFNRLDERRGTFHLALWESEIALDFPNFIAHYLHSGDQVPVFHLAMLLYYFNTADGTPLKGNWISFSELPDGRFYSQAFQGYTGDELRRAFQNDDKSFELAAKRLGGFRHAIGHASFSFQALPRVPLLVVFWQGEEDFPSSFKILFDAAASHYLPTDAYAILGSTLTRRLIDQKGTPS